MTEENQQNLPEPEAETEATENSQAPAPKKAGRKAGLLLLTILFLLLAAVMAAGGWYGFTQLQQLKQAQRNQQSFSDQLSQEQQQNNTDLNQQLNNNSKAIQQLASRQTEMEQLANKSFELTHRAQRGWILAEVDYLLRLAHQRLHIATDVQGAIAALEGADKRIQELGDLTLFPVRETIAEEIGKLQAVHLPDINGAALKLDNMVTVLSDLPFKSAQAEVQSQLQQDKEAEPQDKKPEGFVDSVLSTMMKIGDVKIHQRSIAPASSAQQQQAIEELLRNYILSARLSLLRQDNEQYHHDIQQAHTLLSQYYSADDNRVQNLVNDLSNLGQVNLQPKLPDITGAWTQLQKLKTKSQPADAGDKQEVRG